MPPTHEEALCIRTWEWSETSQVVSLLCRETGLVRGLAKGSRRPNTPYSGGFELLTTGRIGLIHRQNAGLAVLTDWDLHETNAGLRSRLPTFHAGMYVAEVLALALHDHDPHPRVYDAACRTLKSLSVDRPSAATPKPEVQALLEFHWAVLVETGYKPTLQADDARVMPRPDGAPRPEGRTGPEGKTLIFRPDLGVMLDDDAEAAGSSVGTGVESSYRSSGWRVRRSTLEILRDLERAERVSGAFGGPLGGEHADPQGLARACRFLAAYLRHVLGREPSTFTSIFGRNLPR